VTYLHHMLFHMMFLTKFAGRDFNLERYKDRTSISVELTGRMCRFVLQLCWSMSIDDADKHM